MRKGKKYGISEMPAKQSEKAVKLFLSFQKKGKYLGFFAGNTILKS